MAIPEWIQGMKDRTDASAAAYRRILSNRGPNPVYASDAPPTPDALVPRSELQTIPDYLIGIIIRALIRTAYGIWFVVDSLTLGKKPKIIGR